MPKDEDKGNDSDEDSEEEKACNGTIKYACMGAFLFNGY
jgi:hypothetical protein